MFYFGSTEDIANRLVFHNSGKVVSTKHGMPWTLKWYGSFENRNEAIDFERYLKTGSGRAFAYKRLIPLALGRDFRDGRISRSSEASA